MAILLLLLSDSNRNDRLFMTLFVVQVESDAKRNPHIILIAATEKEIADTYAERTERIGYCCLFSATKTTPPPKKSNRSSVMKNELF